MAFWNRNKANPQKIQQLERQLGLDALMDMFTFNGVGYPFISGGTLLQGNEQIGGSFLGYVEGAYKRNGVVFACIAARMLIFSEARFQYQRMRNGRPGDLYGTAALDILETPWPNATTGDLLSRMLLDADLAGNSFIRRMAGRLPGQPARLARLRPDWVTIIAGSDGDPDEADVIGYIYQPGGPSSGIDPVTLRPEEVAHFAPYPDPSARFRGVSWLQPVINDIMADGASTTHKLKFFEQGATPNMVVTLGDANLNPQQFQDWVDKIDLQHAGSINAYKTLYLAAGADATVVGSDLKNVDFKAVQGAGETRIAAAARIHPVLIGLSEGLQGSSLNEGNYDAAKRNFSDGCLRPMWRSAAGSLAVLVDVPRDARLWYDDRDIPFLQEDLKDEAEVQQIEAATITMYVREGFTPESAIAAVQNHDNTLLVHTGMLSVQLQTPGSQSTDTPSLNGSSNGNGNGQQLQLPAET